MDKHGHTHTYIQLRCLLGHWNSQKVYDLCSSTKFPLWILWWKWKQTGPTRWLTHNSLCLSVSPGDAVTAINCVDLQMTLNSSGHYLNVCSFWFFKTEGIQTCSDTKYQHQIGLHVVFFSLSWVFSLFHKLKEAQWRDTICSLFNDIFKKENMDTYIFHEKTLSCFSQ